jgi:hypothetical protein
MTTWEQLSELEQLQVVYSDAHKDAYGFRPRGASTLTTVEQYKAELQRLSQVIAEQEAEHERAQQRAAANFQELVRTTYGGDVAAAKKALHVQYHTHGDDEFLAYHLNLPYRYFNG